MRSKKKYLIIAFLVFAFSAQAQIYNCDTTAYIEVTGIAEKEIVPDEIFITITIKERTVDKEKITIEYQENQLKHTLQSKGIDISNLYLSDANANYMTVRWKRKDVIAKTNYTLKVATATEVSTVFKVLDTLQLFDSKISHVSHSKIEEYWQSTRIEAIKAAKAKADYLLEAIGENTGRALIVREDKTYDAYPVSNVAYQVNYRSSMNLKPESEEEIQFKMITVKAKIYVKFAIN